MAEQSLIRTQFWGPLSDPLATNGVWVKGERLPLRMWMGVGVLRETGTKAYFHQPWTPHGDGEFPTLGVFFVPGMVVWWTTCWIGCPFVL